MTRSLTITIDSDDSTGNAPLFSFDGPLELSDEAQHELCKAILAVMQKYLGQSMRFHKGALWLFVRGKPERPLTPEEIARHVAPAAHDFN